MREFIIVRLLDLIFHFALVGFGEMKSAGAILSGNCARTVTQPGTATFN